MRILKLPRGFKGTILDFGCGLGDAFPAYKKYCPEATLVGVDFSQAAIDSCRQKYGALGNFYCLDYQHCPSADVIIASNVLEHMDSDTKVAECLMSRCKDLFIVVPYREQYLIPEHVRAYDKRSFAQLRPKKTHVFASPGWSQYGLRDCWWQIYAKNALRLLIGKKTLRRRKQIMFHLSTGSFPVGRGDFA